MLYHMHEMQHAVLAPVRLAAEAMQHLYSHPWLPMSYTRLGRTIAASCELLERTTRRYKKPAFHLPVTEINGVKVSVREEKALKTDFCTLLHFKRDIPKGLKTEADPRLLIVAPLSGHYATLLRGTVETLLPDHDIYITDWTDAREVPLHRGGFDLDDYIDLITHFLHHLGPNTHILGVCQPTVPVLSAVSLMSADQDPCAPSSMTLMGGPIDTRANPTKVNEFATSRPLDWFRANVIHTVPLNHAGRGRTVYPGFLQLTGFMSMNMDRHVDAHMKLFQNMIQGDGESAEQHRTFYDEYLSVMDLPSEFYLQTIQTVFKEHALPNGTMVSRGRKVDPSKITRTALMTVEGEKDDITGPGQCLAAQGLCSSLPDDMRRHHLQPKVGHYGVFNGRRWREEIYPNVRSFIRSHDKVLAG